MTRLSDRLSKLEAHAATAGGEPFELVVRFVEPVNRTVVGTMVVQAGAEGPTRFYRGASDEEVSESEWKSLFPRRSPVSGAAEEDR